MTNMLPLTHQIETPRLRFSALAPDVLESMSSWLEGALAPEWTLADLESVAAKANGLLISDVDGVPIGVAVILQDRPSPRCATLPFLAVDPDRRFRGLGGEAGVALVTHLRRKGVESVYAPVPDGRGLAVYFWLRLGFQPLLQGQSPGPVVGLNGERMQGIWMQARCHSVADAGT